jgi:TM2 domain-containing membrane protein YozV
MYCENCGGEIRDGADYCGSCGKKVRDGEAPKTGSGHELTRIKAPKERKNPKAAAALGFFLGWVFLGPAGYIYLGQWNWFWLTLAIQIVAIPLTVFTAYLLLPVVYGIHQYQMAKDINKLLVEREVRECAANPEAPANDPLGRPGA